MPLEVAALVAGTQQNLSNLVFLDIYDYNGTNLDKRNTISHEIPKNEKNKNILK
jgi:hypothetical protein